MLLDALVLTLGRAPGSCFVLESAKRASWGLDVSEASMSIAELVNNDPLSHEHGKGVPANSGALLREGSGQP